MVGLSLHSIIPVRAEAREGAEQNTQMLFGELCHIVESPKSKVECDRWRYIRLENDGQEGWVDAKMITPMSENEYTTYAEALKTSAMVAFPMTYAVSENNGQTIPLTAGTKLTNYKEGRFEVLGVGFRIDPNMVITQPMEMTEQNLLQAVRFFLNTPYLWGGKNALGMDCSGFTQIVLSLFGKHLLRNASEQASQGQAIPSLDQAQAGDLAFFDHEDGRISHVGIIIDRARVIHCSGRVKVEKLDDAGIVSLENGEHTHHFVMLRRQI